MCTIMFLYQIIFVFTVPNIFDLTEGDARNKYCSKSIGRREFLFLLICITDQFGGCSLSQTTERHAAGNGESSIPFE